MSNLFVVINHGPNNNRAMKYRQGFKFELMPDGEQQKQAKRFAGSCRFVFNKAHSLQQERFKKGEKLLGYGDLCKILTQWKKDKNTLWLNETPAQPLQQSLKDLKRGYSNFFGGRAELPRFKKKGAQESFRYPDPDQVKLDEANSRIFLPKFGWIRYRKSRKIKGEIKQVTLSNIREKWFVSIQTEWEKEIPPAKGTVCGIDMGVVRFATLSDTTVYKPLNSFKKHEKALCKAQQALSRKKKFSENWKKAKARVGKLHTRIGNVRRDYLHKTTTTICKNHAIVGIEDLQVKKMSSSTAASLESPGIKVKAKARLNKAILDQGWFEFRRQLEYKMSWKGGRVIAVPSYYTSIECPDCHHICKENRKSQSHFICESCFFQGNADDVGAINILARTLKVLQDEGQDMVHACTGWETTARIACVSEQHKLPATGTHRSDLLMTPKG